MAQPKDYFEENGYVILSNAISKQEAADLTKHMFGLHESGALKKDEQCPLSDAVYGDPKFDALMMRFAKPLGEQLGRELLPTYTYARIYRPGDDLKKHTDRPACEISTTLTLGFDADQVWPIYFDEDKEIAVPLDVGEMAAYKGMEMVHWRPQFKGKWHVQVFLHFVDANGPHKDQYLDGRPEAGFKQGVWNQDTDQQQNQQQNQQQQAQQNNIEIRKPAYNSVYIPSNKDQNTPGYFPIKSDNLPELMFTPEECDKIIDLSNSLYSTAASIGTGDGEGRVHREVRSAEIYQLDPTPDNQWVFDKIAKIVSVVNTIHFDFDASVISHSVQLIKYTSEAKVKGHYSWHVDMGPGDAATRKISLTAQLSDPDTYKGCDLEVLDHAGSVMASRERGSVNLFPSYMQHRVTPIESGDRYALVIWIHGSRRFR